MDNYPIFSPSLLPVHDYMDWLHRASSSDIIIVHAIVLIPIIIFLIIKSRKTDSDPTLNINQAFNLVEENKRKGYCLTLVESNLGLEELLEFVNTKYHGLYLIIDNSNFHRYLDLLSKYHEDYCNEFDSFKEQERNLIEYLPDDFEGKVIIIPTASLISASTFDKVTFARLSRKFGIVTIILTNDPFKVDIDLRKLCNSTLIQSRSSRSNQS